MADWILIPCLRALFAEFDRIAPSRDTASDGAIGNAAHQKEVSDHNPDETGSVPIHDADHINEVHAIDVDNNLRAGNLTMETVVQFLLGRCRSGAERRLRYIIYNRRIWDYRSGWAEKAYTGPSAHTEHAHFSASYETELEASTASWHLEDLSDMSEAEVTSALTKFFVQTTQSDGTPTSRIGRDWSSQGIPDPWNGGDRSVAWLVISRMANAIQAVQGGQAALAAQLTQLLGKDFTDEGAIAAAVLAGLTPERLSAAITDAGLTPEALAAAIPDDLAERTIELLGEKLRPSA